MVCDWYFLLGYVEEVFVCTVLKVRFSFVQVGAFLAGAVLVETNFHTQIEAYIRPFRGLLLGLFFVTTVTSIDTQVFSSFRFLLKLFYWNLRGCM